MTLSPRSKLLKFGPALSNRLGLLYATTMFGRRTIAAYFCLLLVIGLSACVTPENTSPPTTVQTKQTATPPDITPAAIATNTPPATIPTQTPEQKPIPNTHYTFKVILNYTRHHLMVTEKILFYNQAPEALVDLTLMVPPADYPGVFSLNTLAWSDDQLVSDYAWESGRLQIPLTPPLMPGERIELLITYELDLPSPTPSPETRPTPFGYTERQTNLVDWYPFIPPYRPGEGWLTHQAGFFGEHLVYEIADFTVDIQLSTPREDLIIAASAPPVSTGEYYHFEHTEARNFVWSISHQYEVSELQVGAVTVRNYAFPYHKRAGEAVLNTTAEALALYSELFGPYPRDYLSVVEADFLDGMEYDGLYFLSNGFYNLYQDSPGEYLIAIAAHETAHQWFYGLVGNDQALEPWLDEALCTYSERIFYENYYPEALDWWWAYRINYYDPQGPVDGSIYNPGGYRAYRDAVYLNGAVFLEDLRNLIGDDVFFSFLADYVTQNKHKIATGQDFFDLLKKHTTMDLTTLKSRYFATP